MAESGLSKASQAKLVKLTATAKELNAKLHDIHMEIDNILGGKASIGELLKRLEAAFDRAWCDRYAPGQTKRYVWNYTIDVPQMKRLLKSIAPDDLEARFARYVRSDDAFFIRARHGFGLFVRSVNQWAAEAAAPEDFELDAAPVVGCTHTPRCGSDAEHTRRRREVYA